MKDPAHFGVMKRKSDGKALGGDVIEVGEFTTLGGDATESIPLTDVLAGDIVFVTLHTAGSTPRTITSAVAVAGAITVTMSGDPSTDHVLSYLVVRPAQT